MPITAQQAADAFMRAELIHDPDTVSRAIDDMAGSITSDTARVNPILMCVMNGGLILTAQLMPRLAFPLRVDYLHATRYRGKTEGRDLIWRKHPELDLADQTVIVVDDILDEGDTLEAIKAYCESEGAAGVLTAVLVEKIRPRISDVQADYLGLTVPNRYVFGCGMDYKGFWRNADGIFAAVDEIGESSTE